MKNKVVLPKSVTFIVTVIMLMIMVSSCENAEKSGKHLFILSGQSNMQGLRPDESFTPAVESEFGEENVIIVFVKEAP